MRLTSRVLFFMAFAIAACRASADTWYVCTNGSDGADGTSWSTAKATIQAAVDLAMPGDTVLVSNGVHNTGGAVAFMAVLTNRVMIPGGVTVQSLNGPAVTVIQGVSPGGNNAVRCAHLSDGARLAGFTLRNGSTWTNDGGIFGHLFNRSGGGIYAEGLAVVSNCVVTGCTSADSQYGGGVSGGWLYDCVLAGNRAVGDNGFGGGAGGGCVLTHCTIITNMAGRSGGGVDSCRLYDCTLIGNSVTGSVAAGGGAHISTLVNCTLTSNSAKLGGGAYSGSLTNCLLSGNSASDVGGGANYADVYNCTLTSNSADSGGGAYGGTLCNSVLAANRAGTIGGGGAYAVLRNCTVVSNYAAGLGGGAYESTLVNSIVYFNKAPSGSNHYDSGVTNCCTAPLPAGAGNLAVNPQFVSLIGRNYRLAAGSPCIDKGSNVFAEGVADLDGNPRILNGRVDMGAYEYQYNAGYWTWAASITNSQTNMGDCATGDGYPNLLKYAAGSSPTNADELARLSCAPSNGFAAVLRRNTNAVDVTLIVEAADAAGDGAPWAGIATNTGGSWGGAVNVAEAGAGSPVIVTIGGADPAGTATSRFVRLRVSRP